MDALSNDNVAWIGVMEDEVIMDVVGAGVILNFLSYKVA